MHTNDPTTITPAVAMERLCGFAPETFQLPLSFFSITGCKMTNDTNNETLQSTPTLQNISNQCTTRPQDIGLLEVTTSEFGKIDIQ